MSNPLVKPTLKTKTPSGIKTPAAGSSRPNPLVKPIVKPSPSAPPAKKWAAPPPAKKSAAPPDSAPVPVDAKTKPAEIPLSEVFREPETLLNISRTAQRLIMVRSQAAAMKKEMDSTRDYLIERVEEWRARNPELAAASNTIGCTDFSIVYTKKDPRPTLTPESVLSALQSILPEDPSVWQRVMDAAVVMVETPGYYTIYARGANSPRSKKGAAQDYGLASDDE